MKLLTSPLLQRAVVEVGEIGNTDVLVLCRDPQVQFIGDGAAKTRPEDNTYTNVNAIRNNQFLYEILVIFVWL